MTGNKNQIITWLLLKSDEEVFDIEKHKEKRKLTQNAYYWVLLNKLASVLKLGKEELHLKMLKEYSVRYQILLPEEVIPRGITYYEEKSVISKNGKLFKSYMVYTPSHELTKEEFAHLIDGLVTECKEQNIETMTPEEIHRLELI